MAVTLEHDPGQPEAGAPREARAPVTGSAVSRAARPKRSPILVELAVIACLVWIYDWLQNLAPLRRELALRHAVQLLSMEQRLHIAPEEHLDHWLLGHPLLAEVASNFYDNAIFFVTLGLVVWIWWRSPDLYRPLRNYLVLANLIGFSVFWAYPLAPPRMLAGFADVVEKYPGLGGWHNELLTHADQLAAMPSMHLAWGVWSSLAIWQLWGRSGGRTWARLLVIGIAVLYPLVTAWDVMATGNHYLLDVLAGVATTAISVAAVQAASPLLSRWRVRWPPPRSRVQPEHHHW
ncbi:MAG TPA: phosphatase PAP2 family protein [Acidimicrobiales bacterium]|nr:phosphatase PAP2 family protein [Acidimicrobiales bacterium]